MLGVQEDGSVDKRKRYSPAAALAAARKAGYQTSVCTTTLYGYITKRIFPRITDKDLWEKGKKKSKSDRPERRVAHPALPSITDRPEPASQREEPVSAPVIKCKKTPMKKCSFVAEEAKKR